MLLKEDRESPTGALPKSAQRRWLHVQKEINLPSCHFEVYCWFCPFNDDVPSRNQLEHRAPLDPVIVPLPVVEFEIEGAQFLSRQLPRVLPSGLPEFMAIAGRTFGFSLLWHHQPLFF